jgi:hypothetical protein
MWPGMHLAHNSAKLKIFNLPKHIQLLRWGLAASTGPRWPVPAIRWSVNRSAHGSEERRTRQGRVLVQTPNDGSILAEPPFSQRLRLELLGASGPDIQF